MFVHQLTEFIDQIRRQDEIDSFDLDLTNELLIINATYEQTAEVDQPLFELVCGVFSKRWQKIIDSPKDYLRSSNTGTNPFWINLAAALAVGSTRNVMQILIPSIETARCSSSPWHTITPEFLNKVFLSADGKSFYLLSDLIKQIETNHSLAIHVNYKAAKMRPLALVELLRISLTHQGCWNKIKNIMTEKNSRAELPTQILPDLLRLIEIYFENKNKFKAQLLIWADLLLECSIDDVNHLLGQDISVGNSKSCFLDVFISCLKEEFSEDLDNMMYDIARWLQAKDASLVSIQRNMQGLYEDIKVGTWFGVTELKNLLSALDADRDANICKSITHILNLLKKKKNIDSEVMDALAKLYSDRWEKIINREKDYTRLQTGINEPWIHLAKELQAAQLLSKNYYCFLMPSLKHEHDAVTHEPITYFSLSHYILADNGKELILLDNCLMHYKKYGTFYNCNGYDSENSIPEATPLSEDELGRMWYAHPRFHKYIERAKIIFDDPCLRQETILAVKALVDESWQPKGEYPGSDYNKEEMQSAERGYQVFYDFLKDLDAEEHNKLFGQNILLNGKWYKVKNILSDVRKGAAQVYQEEKDIAYKSADPKGCIAFSGRIFAKLVMDYAPHFKFRQDLEGDMYIAESLRKMRTGVRRKFFQKEHDTAMAKTQAILISLMTHDFSKAGMPLHYVSLDDCSNEVPEIIWKIYQELQPLITLNDYKNAVSVLNKIEKNVIEPTLLQYSKSYWSWMFKPDMQVSWLQSIISKNDDSLLCGNYCIYTQMSILDAIFSLPALNRRDEQLIAIFTNDMLRQSTNTMNVLFSNVQANIKLKKLLDAISENAKTTLLGHLTLSMQTPLDNNLFRNKWSDLLQRRFEIFEQNRNHLRKERNSSDEHKFFSTFPEKNVFPDMEKISASITKLMDVLVMSSKILSPIIAYIISEHERNNSLDTSDTAAASSFLPRSLFFMT